MSATATVRLLGPPSIQLGPGTPVEPLTAVSARLLAYLLLEGREHSRERLATNLWPKLSREDGRARLRGCIHRLRAAVGEGALVTSRDRVGISPNWNVETDVWEIARAVSQVQAHHPHGPGRCEDCAEVLQRLRCYDQLPLLEGCLGPDSAEFDDWLVATESAVRVSLEWASEWLLQLAGRPATVSASESGSVVLTDSNAVRSGRADRFLRQSARKTRARPGPFRVTRPFVYAAVTSLVMCFGFVQCGVIQQLFGPSERPAYRAVGDARSVVLAPVVGEKDYLMSSYELQKTSLYVERGLGMLPAGMAPPLAVAYSDFDLDGDDDVFYAYDSGQDVPTDVGLYFNGGWNVFENRPDRFVGGVPQGMHPQKAIVGDYNGDGKPDVFVADAWSPEGPHNLLIYSTGTGLTYRVVDDLFPGSTYGAASADIDGDGDLDILVGESYFLMNDGQGNFTADPSRVPADLGVSIALELVDVDQDGHYDILTSMNDAPGGPASVHWGDGDGSYSDARASLLPPMAAYPRVLDIDCEDLDGDGDRDIIVTRENDSANCLQYLRNDGNRVFGDVTAVRIVDNMGVQGWYSYMARLQDIDGDGDIDCFADNRAFGLVWLNDGKGVLERLVCDGCWDVPNDEPVPGAPAVSPPAVIADEGITGNWEVYLDVPDLGARMGPIPFSMQQTRTEIDASDGFVGLVEGASLTMSGYLAELPVALLGTVGESGDVIDGTIVGDLNGTFRFERSTRLPYGHFDLQGTVDGVSATLSSEWALADFHGDDYEWTFEVGYTDPHANTLVLIKFDTPLLEVPIATEVPAIISLWRDADGENTYAARTDAGAVTLTWLSDSLIAGRFAISEPNAEVTGRFDVGFWVNPL